MPPLCSRALVWGIALGLVFAPAAAREPSLTGGDWPMYRRDPALTAASPLRGGFKTPPDIAWSLDLGGPHVPAESVIVRDFDGDGVDGFLTLGGDTVTCRDSRGRVVWRVEDFLNPNVLDVRDFAGDGSRGILLTTANAGRVDTYMIAGKTGNPVHLWRDENNFGGHTRIGRLLASVGGVQIAATASGQTPPAPHGGEVRLVSFEQGLDRPHFHVRQHVTGAIYSPLILFADLDGDDHDEMVVVSHEQIWAFDPRTGRETFYAAYGPSIRTYRATVAAVKLHPTDRCPALVMINPFVPGLKAVRQDGATGASELWKVVVGDQEDQYQKQVAITPAGPGLVYDLDNDGHYLVLASIRNEHGDGRERLVAFDSRSGQRLAELPGAQVLAVDDLEGDGKPEVLLQRGAELHVTRWKSGELRTVWQGTDVLPVLRPLPSEGDLRLTSGGSPSARGNTTLWREEAGSSRFLLRFADGVRSCRLSSTGLEKGRIVTEHEALGNPPAPHRALEKVAWDGTKLITSLDDREIYRYVPPAPVRYLAPPPLVADLAGRRRILVREAAGKYLLVSPAGTKERVFLDRAAPAPQLFADSAGAGPVVCDMDGDGANEVVATVQDAQGRPACVILDGQGREKQRLEPLAATTTLDRGPTGRLGEDGGRWIVLRMSGETAEHEKRTLVAAYDGRTGEKLWVRDHYGHYGTKPVTFAAHFPSAVLDYDSDGADDWLACSENFYGILSVKDNRDVVGPVVLSDALAGHWTAYTFPSVAALRDGGEPLAYHQGAYSLSLLADLEGRPRWHVGMTRDTAGAWGQFVDLDGDGQREVLHVQPDGALRCFTVGPHARCPTCLDDAPLPEDSLGGPRWEYNVGRPVSRIIAADLDGSGPMEVLFGSDDGNLYALGEQHGEPRLLWSVPLGRPVGEPVIADLDGDGRPSILVSTEDGRLHCLQAEPQ